MPTLKQLSYYYANYIKNKLSESLFIIVSTTTQSKDRRIKLLSALITILKEINKNLNQYNLSATEKNMIISGISTYLGLERVDLSSMLSQISSTNSTTFFKCCESLLEELTL